MVVLVGGPHWEQVVETGIEAVGDMLGYGILNHKEGL